MPSGCCNRIYKYLTVLLEFIDLFGHYDGRATEADGGANASLGLTLAMPLDTYSFIVFTK